MASRVVQEPDHVMVVERVERHAPRAACANEPGTAEQAELVRDRRLAEADEHRKVADASLAMRKGVQQANPRGIAEEFEDVRNGLDGPAGKQARACGAERGRIGRVAFIARRVVDRGDQRPGSGVNFGHNSLYEQLLIYCIPRFSGVSAVL